MISSQRLIVITGALRGLGYYISKRLIQEGSWTIILTSRNANNQMDVVDELRQINHKSCVFYQQLSVDSEKSCDQFAKWLTFEHGKLDVLLNNAGITEIQSKHKCLKDIAREVLSTNTLGVMCLTDRLLPLLTTDGKIINVSSRRGQLALQSPLIRNELSDPDIDHSFILNKAKALIQMRENGTLEGWVHNELDDVDETVYCASKALLNAYTRFVLPKQLSSKQISLCLHPGWSRTSMGTDKADLSPEEGTNSMYKAIVEIPFGDTSYNGLFLNQNGNPWDY